MSGRLSVRFVDRYNDVVCRELQCFRVVRVGEPVVSGRRFLGYADRCFLFRLAQAGEPGGLAVPFSWIGPKLDVVFPSGLSKQPGG